MIASAGWGDDMVTPLADHIAQTQPGLRGFTRRNLFRMRQFYELYQSNTRKVGQMWGQLVWWVEVTKPVSIDRLEALFQQLVAPTLTFICQQK
jgi:DUF1016 N-terminal domain